MTLSPTTRLTLVLLLTFAVSTLVSAQKKDLTLEDYAQWERIRSNTLSPDGTWFAYRIVPVEGKGSLRVKKVGEGDEHSFPFATAPRFSNDNAWLAFAIGVSEQEEEKLEKAKETVELSLGLMNLATAQVDTIEHVQSAVFSDDGKYLALRKYKADGVTTGGTDLVIRDLAAGTHQNVGNVSGYAFSPEGALLAVTIDANEKLGNGVQLLDLAASTIRILDSDEKTFSDLTWRDDSFDLAYLKEGESIGEDYSDHLVVAHSGLDAGGQRRVFDASQSDSFPEGYRIASEGGVRFSEDGSRVFFGLKERWEGDPEEDDAEEDEDDGAEDEADGGEDDDADEDEEEDSDDDSATRTNADRDKGLDAPGVDIWHWKDATVQPRQGVRASADRNFTYLSSWTFEGDGFAKLADDDVRSISLTGDQHHGVGYDPAPYQPALRETWNDVYVIDTETGERERVLERIERVSTSPDGYFVLYFRNDDWWSYSIADGEHNNLTDKLVPRFNNFKAINGREEDRPFGNGQWSTGDGSVLLYSEYDVYRMQADGSQLERLTFGAEDKVRFRQTRVDFEEDSIGPDDPIFFSAYGDFTKDSGYYVLRSDPGRSEDVATLDRLMYEPRSISGLRRAKDANVYMFTTQKADESPNVFLVDETFNSPRQLTDTNPQQADFKWGHTELIDFTNDNGVHLQGRLLYPADYEPGKKYPMIVYIYELRSQSLHSYTTPSRTSAYNQRRFSSEGYFVYEPDIVYRLRDPGMSAVEALVPAVAEVVKTGMIDEDRVGLTGHSWGAYQTSFVVTQTDVFAAAVAGAPLTNMISMYNSMYWNSGGTDATIFEISQGRFPKPYWEDMEKFIQNSPVFNATDINTPLLVAFGDEDGAVDFNQGVEMYNTMRRLEKEFVLLVYDGENHGLRLRQNQMDYANRTHDWFNHFLRDREPAAWIKDGIPFLEKELEKKKADEAREKAVEDN